MPQDREEGTDQSVNWQEEGNQIVAEERGEEAAPPDDKSQERQQERPPAPKQDDKQQTPPQDDKSKQQQQVPPKQDGQQTPPPSQQEPKKDGQTPPDQQTPPQQKAAETPEQKQAREQAEAAEAKKQHEDLVKYYALPEDLAARFATEPETVLPEMAAKLHQAVQNGVQAWVSRFVPQVLAQHKAFEEAESKSKEQFYGRWPSLVGKEKQVFEVGAMYRQMNPNATPEEAIERIGQTVCAALGISPDPKPGQGAPQQTTVVRQNAPVRQAFRPAASASSQAGQTPPADNVWAEEAEQILQEDRTG